MALIVSFANEKGGVGKTQGACEFMLMAQRNGYKVIGVDADPGQSSTYFKMRRDTLSPDLPPLRIVPILGKSVGTQILDFAREADIVVVDVGGRDSQEMRLALLVSHVAIIPASESSADTDVFNKMAVLVNSVRLQNNGLKVWVLASKIPPTNFGATKEAIAAKLEVPIDPNVPDELVSSVFNTVMRSHVVYRKAYKDAYEWGRSVREMKPRDSKAAGEVQGLYQEIIDNG